jgi:outer membrane protein, heavy metal efflux system
MIPTTAGRLAPLFVLAALLAGCATYTPEPLSAQQSLDAARSRSLGDPGLVAYVGAHLPPDAPRPPAWTFESLTWAAYRLSPELAVERARQAVARAGEVTAAEHPNPTLALPFEFTSNAAPGASPYLLGLGLDIPIEAAGLRDARIAQARQRSLAARWELGAAAWRLRSRLRRALLDLRHAQRREALLGAQAQSQAGIVDLLARRVTLGEAARTRLTQAQADLAQVRQRQLQALQAVRQAQAGIARAVGVPLAQIEQAQLRLDDLERPPAPVPEGQALDDALKNRADVQATLADYEASQAALQRAVASQFPGLHLGPGYIFDAGAHKYALSVSGIELPLFNQHRGAIADAQARRREAAARFDAVMAQDLAQVDEALAVLRQAQQQWQLAGEQASSQRRLQTAARRAFDAGATDRLDLAQAGLQAEAAALQREDSLDRLLRAAAALEDALQRPLPAPTAAPLSQEPR